MNRLFATRVAIQTILIGLISTAPGLPGHAAPAAELRPDDTVEQGVAMLAEAVEPRHERAAPDKQVIVDVVSDFLSRYADLQGASRVIVSTHWKTATAVQRARFRDMLTKRVTNIVLDLILDVNFDEVSVEAFDGNPDELPVTVNVTVQTEDASVIRLSFRMHDKFGDWRILDVVAEGVSYLKLYRSEFRQEIAEYGLDQAIERFAQKAAP